MGRKVRKNIGLAAAVAVASLASPSVSFAQGYDMDCKVILCIAGGFPSDCGDAWSYMIDRITDIPPKPPFGFCAMSDGTEYTNHDTRYRFLRGRSPQGYHCPDGKQLHFSRREEDDGPDRITAFCYTHSTVSRSWGDDSERRVTYHNQSVAIPVNFELQVTLEPGTASRFVSPLYRVNYHTGFVTPTVEATQ